MTCSHVSHNHFEWFFETPQNYDCGVIEGGDWILNLVSALSLCNIFAEGKLDSEENQMQITELNESWTSGEEMGGDLNRLEPPKIEDYSKRLAT